MPQGGGKRVGRAYKVITTTGKGAMFRAVRSGPVMFRKKVKSAKAAFRDRVKRILANQTETKMVSELLCSDVTFNSVITNPSDWYRAIPQLAQSTAGTSYTREGKNVTPTSLKVHWNFKFALGDANTRDIFVVLYCMQPKFQKASRRTDVNNQVSFYNSAYLDNGQGANTYFDGTWLTTQYPIEKDLFTLLHKRIFRLSKATGSPNGSGVVGQYDGYGRGMYSVAGKDNIRHTWTHKLPKLNYDDGQYNSITNPDVAAVLPQNTSPVWGVGYYYADGTAADTAGGILKVSCWTEMHFKDD